MRTSKNTPLGILSILAFGFLFFAPFASAQDHVVAIGKVNSDGTLANSADTMGAVVASVRNGAGDYTVTLTAAGAFAGMVTTDYIGEVTCQDSGSDDQVAKITIFSVTNDVMTVNVHIDDVENSTDTSLAEPNDNVFFFSIYQIPAAVPANGSTRYLIGAGKVSAAGALLGGTGVGGIALASTRNSEGSYDVSLTKTGAFAGAVSDDFVIQLSLNGTGVQDDAVRGAVLNLTSDVLTLRVRTDDIQDESDNNFADPQDNTFHFLVYRIGAATGLAHSKLLVALGSVTTGGNLTNGSSLDGGAVASIQNSPGDYTVTITAAGAFSGKTDNQYILQVHMNHNGSIDEVIDGDVKVVDANTLTLDVFSNDGEKAGQDEGDPTNRAFFFLIYDTGPVFRPDLRIGTKRSLTQQRGDDIYNSGGAGQKVNVRLRGNARKKYFITVENDGNLIDDFSLKAKRSGNKVKTKYFRLTGGRENVTGDILSGLTEDAVPPCKIIKYEVRANYKKSRRPKKTLRYTALSMNGGTQLDANKAVLKPK